VIVLCGLWLLRIATSIKCTSLMVLLCTIMSGLFLWVFISIIYYYYYYHYHHHHLFMQGIYTYIPETNYVPRDYSVAAILLLLFMVLISLVSVLNLLYFYISTFRSMCSVPNMAVFCSSLTSCFSGMLLAYFLNDFEIVTVAHIITGNTFVFTFHMRSLYFRIFLSS
jgi:hypothetical protein